MGVRTLQRYSRRARWYHTAIYLTTFVLLATGWWLFAGKEGSPSALARLSSTSDVDLHTTAGWVLTALAVGALVLGARGSSRFLAESVTFHEGDFGWLIEWPGAAITGRFRRHEGHFDPGQRIANLAIAGLLLVLVASGVTLVLASGGSWFVWALRAHKWATYLLTPILIGHVVVASGILPGYRGVWRSIHWGGRLREETARRLWPRWAERELNPAATSPHSPGPSPQKD